MRFFVVVGIASAAVYALDRFFFNLKIEDYVVLSVFLPMMAVLLFIPNIRRKDE